jgi:hypothetical protein
LQTIPDHHDRHPYKAELFHQGENDMTVELDQVPSALLNVSDESFWRSLNPDLHITAFPLSDIAHHLKTDAAAAEQCTARIIKEGYFQAPALMSRKKAARLARLVAELHRRKIAPVFAFVYDEFWQLLCGIDPVLRSALGDGYKVTPSDIWVWHVNNDPKAAGWGPHRDMLVAESVRDDGRPRVINVWTPLTDATPLNACMYMLPTNLDPNVPKNLEDCAAYRLNAFQNIRAVPAEAGSAVGWNTQILHWGGRSSEWADQPRISVAVYVHSPDCELNDMDFEQCREGFAGLAYDKTFEMPFRTRLRAIAAAIQLYSEKVRVDYPEAARELFAFSTEYIKK